MLWGTFSFFSHKLALDRRPQNLELDGNMIECYRGVNTGTESLTLRPALLLCRLTTARSERADRLRPVFSPASTNDLANATPYAMLSEQPDHLKLPALSLVSPLPPSRVRRRCFLGGGERVATERSQPQRSSCPELHARVTA